MKKELNYMDSVHYYGRIWGIIVAIALLSFPLILSLIFKTAPDFKVLWQGIVATVQTMVFFLEYLDSYRKMKSIKT